LRLRRPGVVGLIFSCPDGTTTVPVTRTPRVLRAAFRIGGATLRRCSSQGRTP
jgi:hypothetical protein